MAKFIELMAIDRKKEEQWIRQQEGAQRLRELDFAEDDTMASDDPDERIEGEVPPTAPATPGLEPAGLYTPIAIFAHDVRAFYPRKGSKPGTRIVYHGGAAQLVKESFADVKTAFAEA